MSLQPETRIDSFSAQPGAESQHGRYMPYLDGLRAVALFAVLISHFAYDRNWLYLPGPEWGRLGVDLFFVLSGFLITQILLRYRDASQNLRDVAGHLRTFYIRRSLRIFPIYYLTIAIAAILGYPPVRDYLWWHLTYTSNIAVSLFHVEFEAVNHFWTLCIEEQFYILWPWVVLLVPRKALRYIIFGLIVIGVLARAMPLFTHGIDMGRVLATRVDVLALGALLALYWHEPSSFSREKTFLFTIGVGVGLPFAALYLTQVIHSASLRDVTRPFVELGAGLFFMTLIHAVAQPRPWGIFAPLGWKPVRYIGKISYGVYVYHLFVRLFVSYIYELIYHQKLQYGIKMVVIGSIVSILLGTLSWYLIESPISRLKERITSKQAETKPILLQTD